MAKALTLWAVSSISSLGEAYCLRPPYVDYAGELALSAFKFDPPLVHP